MRSLSPGRIANGIALRKRVLLATLEYEIRDWDIEVDVGRLGDTARLLSKNFSHQDLIWVVPCVGDVEYPQVPDETAEPINVKVLDDVYQVQIRAHVIANITYILLDAPIFRKQRRPDLYPSTPDNTNSALFHSCWNQCIAEAIRRYKPDLYHIYDFNGAIAPLYLLPELTVPCALSVYHTDIQGSWSMQTEDEATWTCALFNLDRSVVESYVDFRETFNMLHAGASYLRLHQNGYGAMISSHEHGVKPYTSTSVFWGLRSTSSLPSLDVSDTAECNAHTQAAPRVDTLTAQEDRAEETALVALLEALQSTAVQKHQRRRGRRHRRTSGSPVVSSSDRTTPSRSAGSISGSSRSVSPTWESGSLDTGCSKRPQIHSTKETTIAGQTQSGAEGADHNLLKMETASTVTSMESQTAKIPFIHPARFSVIPPSPISPIAPHLAVTGGFRIRSQA